MNELIKPIPEQTLKENKTKTLLRIDLSKREIATVRAALRIFQNEADYDSNEVYGMSDFTEDEPLGNDEIDELCRRLTVPKPQQPQQK